MVRIVGYMTVDTKYLPELVYSGPLDTLQEAKQRASYDKTVKVAKIVID